MRRASFVPLIVGGILVILNFSTYKPVAARALSDGFTCRRDFQGLEYCTADDGNTHIVKIDLTDPNVHFDVATASNAKGPNPPVWQPAYRQTVAQMAEDHATLEGLPLAVAIDADYGAGNGTHGWEGFMVQRGVRLDGPGMNGPDCDCAGFDRSSLTLSRDKPTKVGIGSRIPAELDQQALYSSKCINDPAFQGCKSAVLQRTPSSDEQKQYERNLQNAWYTAVGGGPVIVRDGQSVPISRACAEEKFSADWCQDSPKATVDRLRQLRMNTVVGVTSDGKQLILIVTTARLPNEASRLLVEQGAWLGLRFDGSESAQFWYNGAEQTANRRAISNSLLVYAALLPEDDAQLPPGMMYDVAVAGETATLTLRMTNTGRNTWRTPDYALVVGRNTLPGAPKELSVAGEVRPGEIATWTLELPIAGGMGVQSVSYQLEHNGQTFGPTITGYVFVLPEELKSAETRIRDRIAELERQGRAKGEELVNQIWQEIKAQAERQVNNLLQKLLSSICGGSTGAVIVTAGAMLWTRKRRP